MATTPRVRTPTVRVQCSKGHVVSVTPDEIRLVHRDRVVVGMLTHCPTCNVVDEQPRSPAVLAVLHAFGVTGLVGSTETPGTPGPTDIGIDQARRDAVSLRVMLDHPELWREDAGGEAADPDAPEIAAGPSPAV